ncbi:MAG: 3-deoxy-D-manno-octulosonic acid transferase [Chlamydiia bacterium]|nr:3-deoxy-D-manno-octulosonic acid transferase [Chlamydiia bacterium]MCH9615591.1 3-deoxy-D-manno-octulosonic acid transferase [Chlamydiia bacterium]MCH9629246.1 3-deoxy-D-manno-octulosonic acid transferase [Chlamydiia bacterium]
MIYDLGLSLVLLGMLFKKRKLPPNLLGKELPPLDHTRPVIWIHAVSVGETKAASTLIPHIKASHPSAQILITNITETGHKTAQKEIPEAHHLFMPLDLSWVMKSFIKKMRPNLLIVMEGDYWLNMLKEVKRQGGHIAVVNGKVSTRSTKRYRYFKRLFKPIDLFCVQNTLYQERYQTLNIPHDKIAVTGNVKFDIPKATIRDLGLKGEYITLASTHEGEEKALIDTILPSLPKHIKILVAPRHPERFDKVRELLKDYDPDRVILIDRMGLLGTLYSISKAAIVGGSFNSNIGGHDVFEPINYGTPVIFGPHMHKQLELRALTMGAGIGFEATYESLSEILLSILNRSFSGEEMALKKRVQGTSKMAWENILLRLNP